MSTPVEKNFKRLRNDFPILKRKINGRTLVYLDSAATSQKPKQVINAVSSFYSKYNANIYRGIYQISEEATALYEIVRKKVKDLINSDTTEEIVFTRGTTESINLIRYTWGEAIIRRGDNIVTTIMEHHSNFVPWQELCRKKKAELRIAPITKDGKLDLGKFYKLINKKTKLIAISHASNMLGTINPVAEISRKLKTRKLEARILVDGAQSVPHMPVDVRKLGCDFFAFSGHKMLGPTGIGVLYAKKDVLENMPPFLTGGHMIREVNTRSVSWNDIPWKFEAGTPNIAGVIGLGVAIDYLGKAEIKNIREHEEMLTSYAILKLRKISGLTIYGPKNCKNRVSVISFTIKGAHPHDIATLLDYDGISVRAGHHCTMPLHREALGIEASARASFYIYNTKDDVDRLVKTLKKAIQILRG